MIQLKIAFLDEEEAYLEQLNGYLIRKKETFFKIWTFSKAEAFFAVQERVDFDGVVMTAAFWDAVEECVPEVKRILLKDQSAGEELLKAEPEGEGNRKAMIEPGLCVAKYQSVEKLLSQIVSILWQEEMEQQRHFPENMAELIGVYSPIGYEGQMLFSMTMAQILSEEKKVLYVNLMEHSGFYHLTGTDTAEDVGDLFYGMLQGGQDFGAGLHRMRQSFRDFDYIPPVANPEHLSEISKSLYEQFLMSLKNSSGYDVVIVDFGTVFLGFAEMLPLFSTLYCLGKEGVISRYRTEEFLEYLNKESTYAKTHIQNLVLSERMLYAEDVNPLESSLYGSMGDYIRRNVTI